MVYTDPDGEWIHLLIGGIVGGAINLATNWDNIDGFWEGVVVFGVGAGAGVAAAATGGASLGAQAAVAFGSGALVASTNNVISQTGENFSGFNEINWNSVGNSGLIGGFSGLASFGAAKGVSSVFKGDIILGQGFKISGKSIPGMAIKQGLAGFAGGYAGGFTAGYLYTGDFSKANEFGLKGGYLGGGLGVAFGAGTAYYSAKHAGYNPWTGKYTPKSIRNRFDIPENWVPKITDNGKGIKFVDPNNSHHQVRFMNGDPYSPNIWQRDNYIQIKYNGQSYDAFGNLLPNAKVEGAHIQINKIDFEIIFPWNK